MIPKIIHYFWSGNVMLARLQEYLKTWRQHNSGYEIRLWTIEDFADVPFVQECEKYNLHGYAVDYVKPYVLCNYGGIYLDTDVEVLRPLDDLLDNECFAGWEHEDYDPPFLGTAIIGACKGNKAVKAVSDYYTTHHLIDNDKLIAPSHYVYNEILSKHNIKIYNQQVLYPSDNNTEGSYTIHHSQASWVRRYDEIKSNHLLTACICYRNEGDEVENTIKSILETTSHTKIMLVDDCSDDNYDYKSVADRYHCDYHRMSKRVGSVGAKDYAGHNATSENFVLLDGHMRFYQQRDWDLQLVKLLDKYPQSIISSRTSYISRDSKGDMIGDDKCDMRSYCAYMRFDDGFDFDPRWTDKILNYDEEYQVSDVSCILGACYATSKFWWGYIGGLQGLNTYGLEESLLSIKTWMLGGSCKVTHDFAAGHLYRNVNPNTISTENIDASRLYMSYLFDANPTLVSCNLYKRLGMFIYGNVMNTFAERFNEYLQIKSEFDKKVVNSFAWFKKYINKQVVQ